MGRIVSHSNQPIAQLGRRTVRLVSSRDDIQKLPSNDKKNRASVYAPTKSRKAAVVSPANDLPLSSTKRRLKAVLLKDQLLRQLSNEVCVML